MSQSDYLMAHAWSENTSGFSIDAMLAHLARHGLAGDLFDGQANRGNAYRLSVPTSRAPTAASSRARRSRSAGGRGG